ncbi:MAG TPA: hypothetical protein ENK83_04350 [Aliiroseovarius sp.]|nr:hypothetical protein [Aliiroseovarius sp.]
MKTAALACGLGAALPLHAGEATSDFVKSNVLATLYHEFGHALIDIQRLPVFGQEEDAADVASILLIDAFYDEESAVALAYDTAFGFLGESERADAEGQAPAYWDVHGPDEQRYYNLVCLFYGADPDEREAVARDLGLPEERAETCADEFDLANASWGAVFDEMTKAAPGNTIRLGKTNGPEDVAQLLKDEVKALNEDFVLAADLTISLDSCGEANAFYDPDAREITICSEFLDDLAQLAP